MKHARFAAVGVVALIAVGVAAKIALGNRALTASAQGAEAFAAAGFVAVPVSAWRNPEVAEESVAAGSCVIALGASTSGPIPIEIVRNGESATAIGSVGFCTCAAESVIVRARGGSGARSVRLLRADAGAFGGVLGFATSTPKPASVAPCSCTEEHVDEWLERSPRPNPADPAATLPAAFKGFALSVSASAPAAMPLVPFDTAANQCTVVFATEESDTLSLRASGGARLIPAAKGAIAVCSKTPRTLSAWHEGKGNVLVLRGDAARLGGRYGLGKSVRGWTEAADVAWDAELALASASAHLVRSAPWAEGGQTPPEARVLAFGFVAPSTKFEPPPGGTCFGAASGGVVLCAQGTPQAWRTTEPPTAMAGAPVPSWLKVISPAQEEGRVAIVSMMNLASRMFASGFELSALEGVTEVASGAEVLGRAGENALVAVAVQARPPHVVPLSLDGVPWSIDGEGRGPVVVPIAPGQRLQLRSTGPLAPAPAARRTIVFRRSGTLAK